MYSPEELSYIAGFADGEGCITSNISKKRNTVRPRFAIENCDKPVLDWIAEFLGKGRVYGCPSRMNRAKPVFSYIAVCNQALDAVEILLPYLRVKKVEAIEFLRLRHATGEERHAIHRKLSLLKKGGL